MSFIVRAFVDIGRGITQGIVRIIEDFVGSVMCAIGEYVTEPYWRFFLPILRRTPWMERGPLALLVATVFTIVLYVLTFGAIAATVVAGIGIGRAAADVMYRFAPAFVAACRRSSRCLP